MNKILLTGIISCFTLTTLISCGGDKEKDKPKEEAKIVLGQEEVTFEKFEGFQITYTLIGTTKQVTWSVNDASIASVNDGYLTGLKTGDCTLTAKAGDVSATCLVHVIKPSAAATMYLETNTINILKGDTVNKDLYALYKGVKVTDASFTFSFDESVEKVVDVNYSNDQIKISALKEGTNVITISTNTRDTLLVDTLTVNVYDI